MSYRGLSNKRQLDSTCQDEVWLEFAKGHDNASDVTNTLFKVDPQALECSNSVGNNEDEEAVSELIPNDDDTGGYGGASPVTKSAPKEEEPAAPFDPTRNAFEQKRLVHSHLWDNVLGTHCIKGRNKYVSDNRLLQLLIDPIMPFSSESINPFKWVINTRNKIYDKSKRLAKPTPAFNGSGSDINQPKIRRKNVTTNEFALPVGIDDPFKDL